MQAFWKEKIDCKKMYGYLPWCYYFVIIFINIIIINLNILDYRCLFSGRKSISSKYLFIIIIIIITLKKQKKK